MSFAATLSDLSFPEILHLIAFNKKSGKLTLTCHQGHSLILFRQGRIIYAASAGLRESFGSILLCRGLITDADLIEALEFQDQFAEERRLGAILVEMGKLSQSDVKEALKEQSLRVIREVMQWRTGFFKFEPLEVPQHGEAEVGVAELLENEGFDAEGVLLEVVTQLDEAGEGVVSLGSREREAAALEPRSEAGQRRAIRVPPEWETAHTPRLASLASIMAEIQSPSFTGEIALALMRYAAQIVNRGVFLVVRGQEAVDVGRFGTGAEAPESLVRSGSIRIPLSEPSFLLDLVQKRETYQGPLGRGFWNQRFVEMLGGVRPQEVLAIPLTIQGRVAFIFYGDNVPQLAPIGPTQGLEFLMIEAGLVMERMDVRTRVHAFQRQRKTATHWLTDRLG